LIALFVSKNLNFLTPLIEMVQSAVEVLLPSAWEIEVAVVASVFLIASYWLFAYRGGGDDDVVGVGFDRSRLMQNLDSGDAFDKDKVFISSSSFL
jgi:hypothetical protein